MWLDVNLPENFNKCRTNSSFYKSVSLNVFLEIFSYPLDGNLSLSKTTKYMPYHRNSFVTARGRRKVMSPLRSFDSPCGKSIMVV